MWASSSFRKKNGNNSSNFSSTSETTKMLTNDDYEDDIITLNATTTMPKPQIPIAPNPPREKMSPYCSSLPTSPYGACYYYNNNQQQNHDHDHDQAELLMINDDNNEWNNSTSTASSSSLTNRNGKRRRRFKQLLLDSPETSFSSSMSSVGEKQSLHCSLMSRFFKFGRKRNNNSNNINGPTNISISGNNMRRSTNSPFQCQQQQESKTAGIRNRISRSFSFHNNNSNNSTINNSKSHFYYKIDGQGGCYRQLEGSTVSSTSVSANATPMTVHKFKVLFIV